jgi:hypothetical protein
MCYFLEMSQMAQYKLQLMFALSIDVLKDILAQQSPQIGGFVIVYIENAGMHCVLHG